VQIPSRSEKRAAAAVLGLPACLYHTPFPCSIARLFLPLRTQLSQTGPSNTFVIRQSQRLNIFTTNNLISYFDSSVPTVLTFRLSVNTATARFIHSSPRLQLDCIHILPSLAPSLFRLVRPSVYASREATYWIISSNNAGNFVFDH
jgi:hypothetical protein